MTEKALVNKVISRGQLVINIPSILLFITTMGIFLYLQKEYEYPEAFMLIGLPIGILVGWFYWSLSITTWRTWAYAKVNDITLLNNEAVKAKLLWKKGSFFNRTALCTQKQKDKLQLLETKSEAIPFPALNDKHIAKKTVLKYPTGNKVFDFILAIGMLSVGIYFINENKAIIIGGVIVFLSLYKIYNTYKKHKTVKHTKITIDKFGISFDNEKIGWKSIIQVKALNESDNRQFQEFKITTKNRTYTLDIGDYNFYADDINDLLAYYRSKNIDE